MFPSRIEGHRGSLKSQWKSFRIVSVNLFRQSGQVWLRVLLDNNLTAKGKASVAFLRQIFDRLSGMGRSPERSMQSFQRQRQKLQDHCIAMASASGKPRGLRWTKCDWLDTFSLVENQASGILTLFCGVNLSFEAIEGGDMEGVDAVGMVRDATAVFHFQNHRWGTGGRVLFNMTPSMAAATITADEKLVLTSD